jgi:hypothetical protein
MGHCEIFIIKQVDIHQGINKEKILKNGGSIYEKTNYLYFVNGNSIVYRVF